VKTAPPVWRGGPIGDYLVELLVDGIADQTFPAASAYVWSDGRVVGQATAGLDLGDIAPDRRLWDLASLTKPLSIGLLAMRAVSNGTLDLDKPVFTDLPAHLTGEALLSHRGGLVPWRPWVKALPAGFRPGGANTRFALEALIRQAALDSTPGAPAVYSDVGYMLLQRYFETKAGRSLRDLIVGYPRPGPPRRTTRFVESGLCPERQRVLVGEVHDPQAWAWGGAAGHAGLFGTARSVGETAVALLKVSEGTELGGATQGIAPAVVRRFWAGRSPTSTPGSWQLGWDTPSPGASSSGTTVAPDAIGHLGFTGTSVWIEPSRRLVIVLLSNRVMFGEEAQARIRRYRPRFHDAIRRALGLS